MKIHPVIRAAGARVAISTLLASVPLGVLAQAPGPPPQAAPADGAWVATFTPTLVVDNVTHTDPITLTYDFQLNYYYDPGPTPTVTLDQEVAGLAEGSGGQTSWTPAPIPENTWVFWRVRTCDSLGLVGCSPWSGYFSFFVNTVNEPPAPPVLTKPMDGEVVLIRSPTLEVNNTSDPEGDAIEIYFEVATDDTFTTLVQSSPGISQSWTGSFTNWVDPMVLLDFGATYAARACAMDSNGAMSGCSNVSHFSTPPIPNPSDVDLLAPFDPSSCIGVVFGSSPQSFSVSHSVDPWGNRVTLDLEIYRFADTPGASVPVIADRVPQDPSGLGTTIPIDSTQMMENAHYRVRVRADTGFATSAWTECDFWIDSTNSTPGGVVILSPTPGTSFPFDAQTATVTVQNADDADAAVPGTSLSIALCVTADATFADCPGDPALWRLEPSIADPNLTTDLLVTELTNGSPLAPDLTVHLQACALDERGACGPVDTSSFGIDAAPDLCAGVSCGAGEVCETATGNCITTTCSTAADCLAGQACVGGSCVTPARCEGGGGCARDGTECATARDGRAEPALAAVFLLLALVSRRRREILTPR